MKLERTQKVQAGKFSMAAMSDMAFLLIIFFMVCAKFVEKSDLQVELPVSLTAEKAEEVPIVITITEGKNFFVNGILLTASELLPELRGRLRGAENADEKTIMVRADKSLTYGDIRPAIDAVDKSGGMLELSALTE